MHKRKEQFATKSFPVSKSYPNKGRKILKSRNKPGRSRRYHAKSIPPSDNKRESPEQSPAEPGRCNKAPVVKQRLVEGIHGADDAPNGGQWARCPPFKAIAPNYRILKFIVSNGNFPISSQLKSFASKKEPFHTLLFHFFLGPSSFRMKEDISRDGSPFFFIHREITDSV
ncbi:hypothetical protein EVAR_88820_1 [Eumeta japonica]|uniref:Uncharacterized protein n=1 Tax=Eumeta variegata TaxID=151549 RepID=A0A4C1Y437_EUMVA|nr:hypothetical protein EVAR_88820_1 [Eumeta japonica]